MNTKILSLAAFAMMTIASVNSVQAEEHYAVTQMNACKKNNNDCTKFDGKGTSDVAQAACKEKGCVAGCTALMEKFGGPKELCK